MVIHQHISTPSYCERPARSRYVVTCSSSPDVAGRPDAIRPCRQSPEAWLARSNACPVMTSSMPYCSVYICASVALLSARGLIHQCPLNVGKPTGPAKLRRTIWGSGCFDGAKRVPSTFGPRPKETEPVGCPFDQSRVKTAAHQTCIREWFSWSPGIMSMV